MTTLPSKIFTPIICSSEFHQFQETYDRQRLLSYVGTDLVVVCYSVTSPQSLQDVSEKWIPEVRRYSTTLPFILVGLKVDERSDHQRASQTSTTSTGSRDSFKNAVSSTESLDQDIMPWLQEHIQEIQIVDKKLAKKVAKSEGALAHIEVSAKTGQGVEFLFTNTLAKVLDEHVLKKKKRSSLVKKLGKLLNSGKKEGEENNIETQSTRSN